MWTSFRSMRGLALVALLSAATVASCSSDTTSPTPPSGQVGSGTSADPITIFITNSVYSPNPQTVKVAQFVNFKNNDNTVHSATFDNGTYESGDIPALSAHDIPVQLTATGTFTFHCRFHGERGSIVVVTP